MSAPFRTVVAVTLGRPWRKTKIQHPTEEDDRLHQEVNLKGHHDHNGNGKGRARTIHLNFPSAPLPRSGFRSARNNLNKTSSNGYGACSDCLTPFDIQTWASNRGQGQPGQQGQPLTALPTGGGGGSRPSLRTSPERHRASLDRVPEYDTMDFRQNDEDGPTYVGGAPLSDDPSEIERELEEELEEHGLYRGSYQRLTLLYGTVPLTFVAAFSALAALPYLIYPARDTNEPPLYTVFPSPIPEFISSVSFWSLFYLLQDPLYAFITYIIPPLRSTSTLVTTSISILVQTIISLILRISALNLLEIPFLANSSRPTTLDPAFRKVWWLALGWALAEAVLAIKQGYDAIALYSDVLVTVQPHEQDPETLGTTNGATSDNNQRKNETTPLEILRSTSNPSPRQSEGDRSLSASPDPPANDNEHSGSSEQRRQTTVELFNQQVEDDVYGQERELDEDGERQPLLRRQPANQRQREIENALRQQVDQDIDDLIALRAREELEEVYGMPVIHIPVFLSCLQRINALFMSLGSLLLISHAYMQSTLIEWPPVSRLPPSLDAQGVSRTNTPLLITLPAVALIHYILSILHTSLILPRFGVPAVVYTGSIVSLMMFMAGLGVWDGLS